MLDTAFSKMKKLQQIYKDYQILHNLVDHQVRVAAVAKLICDNFNVPLNTADVVRACLFHDMGNIIKFDLSHFPESLEPEGRVYWQEVKDEFIRKYGPDEHRATQEIGREIGFSPTVMTYLDNIGFSKLDATLGAESFEQKICSYADMRVGPYGVLSIEERLVDGKRRYEGRKQAFLGESFDELASALGQMEKQIFSFAKISPEDITDGSIEKIFLELKNS